MTDQVQFTSSISVQLVKTDFSDTMPVIAARTSTAGSDASSEVTRGLIDSLMKNRHDDGSPFEHMTSTWQVTAPIFVWREHVRHRIASYSEESARYRQLRPLFYLTDEDRKITQVGKPMDYDLREGSDDLKREVNDRQAAVCYAAYANYQELLSKGVAREVARNCLPVNIMSTCMVTMNSRGLMNFLSLRHKSEDSSYDTNPLHEIDLVAQGYENTFKEYAPLTHEAFVKFGRVAP